MTVRKQKKRDIINTAFVQWSKDLYTKTSLTDIAKAMNMTKPGLFRYFACKEQLCQQMINTYLTDLIDFTQQMFSKTEGGNLFEMLDKYIRQAIQFFLDNKEKCYYQFFTSPKIKHQIVTNQQFEIFRNKFAQMFNEKYYQIKQTNLTNSEIHAILIYIFYASSVVFWYHKTFVFKVSTSELSEQMIDTICYYIISIIQNGMAKYFQGEILNEEELINIENDVIKKDYNIERNKFFEAVTSVIEKKGIASASMEQIAKQLGFNSKSSLYQYFTNKESMFEELFENESGMMVNYIKSNGLNYDNLGKDFYGSMVATFCYFTKDSGVLKYFDWLHYNMVKEEIKFDKNKMMALFRAIANGIKGNHDTVFDLANQNQEMFVVMTVELLSSFIVRTIVHRNVLNGGKTPVEEVTNLRKIYYLYMKGLAG